MKKYLLVLIIVVILFALVAQAYTTQPVCKKITKIIRSGCLLIRETKIICQYKVCNYVSSINRYTCTYVRRVVSWNRDTIRNVCY